MDEKKHKEFVKAFNDVTGEIPDYNTWYYLYGKKFDACPVCGGTLSVARNIKVCDSDNCSWDTWKRYQMIFCGD